MSTERIDMALRFVAAIHMEWVALIPRLSATYRTHAETCALHCERVTGLLTLEKQEQESGPFTMAQYATLGKLVMRWTTEPDNNITFYVTPEVASHGALLCVVSSKPPEGGEPVRIVHGIERDGHCHT